MNRHDAYKLLSETLQGYQKLPFSELESLVGCSRSERARSQSGEEFLLVVSVEWSDEPAKRLRIAASADSPSTFRMERLEEHVFVSGAAD